MSSPGIKGAQKEMITIHYSKIDALITFRKHFGSPNYFKLFRAFYKLSVITSETQNNPFSLYMDRNSVIRGFKEVFGVENEEVAIRFYHMFVMTDGEMVFRTNPRKIDIESKAYKLEEAAQEPRSYQVDILRFYHICQLLFD
jgi:hypothetical protein